MNTGHICPTVCLLLWGFTHTAKNTPRQTAKTHCDQLCKNLNPARRTGKNDCGCMAQMMCTSCVGCSQVNNRTVIRRVLMSQSHRLAHQGSIAFVCWHRCYLWRPTDCLFEMPINVSAIFSGTQFWVGFESYSGNTIFALVFVVLKHSRLSPCRIFFSPFSKYVVWYLSAFSLQRLHLWTMQRLNYEGGTTRTLHSLTKDIRKMFI